MASNDMHIRKGQALNLAVAVAIEENKHNDNMYIMQQTFRFFRLINLIQSATPEQLETIIDNPKVAELFDKLEKQMNA